MLVLTATVCLLADLLIVECRTMAVRVETDRAECVAMIAPDEAMLRSESGTAQVVYLKAVCKLGVVS